jgi:hypothetical protein
MRYGKYFRPTAPDKESRWSEDNFEGASARDLKKWSELYTTDPKDNRMDTNQTMEERLWDYMDGLGSPAQRAAIADLIRSDTQWGVKYQELLEAHQLLTASDLEAPSLRFTKNVMEEIARFQVAPATRTYINKNVIRGIGAFFLVTITGFLVYFLSQFKWSTGSYHSDDHTPLVDRIGFAKVDWTKVFTSVPISLFLLVLVVLGFIFLDMRLQRRKKQAI